MLDAYVGTIDYEDETLEDAMGEVTSFLDDDRALLDRSYLVEDDGMIASAVLVSLSEGRPFIGYVMTRASHKNHGLARLSPPPPWNVLPAMVMRRSSST